MPGKKSSEFKAGLFVLLSLILLAGLVMWIGSISLVDRASGSAWFCSNAASGPVGLKEGYDVMYGDHKVGTVSRVIPDYKRGMIYYKTDFDEEGFDLFADGRAEVSSGMLGGGSLSIVSLGSSEKGLSSRETPIVIGPGGMQAAMNGMRQLSADLLVISGMVKKELDSGNKESVVAGMKMLVTDLGKVSSDLVKISNRLVPETDFGIEGSLVSNFKKVSVDMAKVTERLREYSGNEAAIILANIRKVSTSLLETAGNIGTSSSELKELLVENSGNLDRMVEKMTMMAADLKATASEVRRNPWRLLYTPNDKELKETQLFDAARSFERASRELNVIVNRLESLKKLSADDPEAKQSVQDVRKHMLKLFDEFRRAEETFWKQLSELK